MRWIRLNIDFDNTAWLFSLSPAAQMAWIKLICHVKRDGVKGRCKALEPRVAAARFAVPVADIEAMLQAAIADQALTVEKGYWTLTGWTEYQEVDNRVADRVRRHRARQPEELPFEEGSAELPEDGSAEFPLRPPVPGASAPPPTEAPLQATTQREGRDASCPASHTEKPPKAKETPEAAGCVVPAPHADQHAKPGPSPVGRGCPSLATPTEAPLHAETQREGRDASCPASHANQPPCNGVTTVTPPVTRHATETGTKTETQTDSFSSFWAAYPPRAGDRKRNASEALFRKLIGQKIPPATLVEGAKRYRAYCEATGKIGTEFVQQASTWLKNKAWENDFRPVQELPKRPVKDIDYWEADPIVVHVDFQGREVDANSPTRYGTAIRRRLFWIRQGNRTEEPFAEEAWHEQRRFQ